jgi:geranylgeranyl diphosphate synthase type I
MEKNEDSFENLSGDEMVEQVEKLLEDRGKETLEMARNEVLQEKVESKEVQEALRYFMTEYWRDVTRPALMSLVCEAVGGNPDKATPVAVSMILISGAIDIHDDIIDESKTKGSRPTVLGKFGRDIALLVGDALLFKGFTLLYKAIEKGISTEKASLILSITKETFFKLGDAEACELRFRGRQDVTPDEYIYVAKKKAADVEAYTRISVILGDGSLEEVEVFGKFGMLLGLIIILRDDLIDMIEFEELVHRIDREHLPLPILYALQNPKFKSTLNSTILKKEITESDAETILEVTEKAGGFKRFRTYMEELENELLLLLKNLKYRKMEITLIVKTILLPLDELGL